MNKSDSMETVQERSESLTVMGQDQYYDDGYVAKVLPDSIISRRNYQFHGMMGFQSFKRFNVHFLTDDTIIYAAGNKYQTYNLNTKETKTFHGKDTDGVGSVGVHPSRKFFAVAEQGEGPLIYIYAYPSLRLYRTLAGGTEKAYVHCEFSTTGQKLVSVGSSPDFTITVWDWMAQRVVLKAKAFSADVFRASFSPQTDNIIITSGSGHIKFWKMAETFTGLKLQGEIAKFGKLELSDVSSFYELPDGKVISGTDQGNMILWDGVQVKAHLVQKYENGLITPLHDGAIEVILFEQGEFITAAHDGFIKWWSLSQIDNAEADEITEVEIQPLREIQIKSGKGVPAKIINMVKGNDFWLVQDARGYLWRVSCIDFESVVVMEFHCGAITDMAVSDQYNISVSCSEDGNIKLWDYVRMKPLYEMKYNGRAECIDLLARSDINKGRVAAVGYSTGIVRVIYFTDEGIQLAKAFKAADAPIVKLKFAPSQTMLVTASKDGEIFFFETNGHSDLSLYQELCMVKLPEKAIITDLKWDSKSSKIIVSTDKGRVYEYKKPLASEINNKETYLVDNYPYRMWQIKMLESQMKKNQKKDEAEEERKRRARLRGELPPEEEEEEEDWAPEAITSICYTNDGSGQFLLGSVGNFAGFFYRCEFGTERPLESFQMPAEAKLSVINYNPQGDLLLLGLNNGDVRIFSSDNLEKFISIKQHDGMHGRITCAKLSFDERFLVTSGSDGLVMVHTFDKQMIQKESKFDPCDHPDMEGIEYLPADIQAEKIADQVNKFQAANPPQFPVIDPAIDGLDESLLAISLRIPKNVEDITDESVYSIQQAKLRTEEDHRLKLADEKKQNVRNKIKVLRKNFMDLQKKNQEQKEMLRVSNDDFNIDPDYFETLYHKNDEKIKETRKEVQWGISYHKKRLDKLKEKFYDVLDFEKFTVKALRTQSYVTSFRCAKMSESITTNIKLFKEMLEKEIEMKEQNDFNEVDGLFDERESKTKELKKSTNFYNTKKAETTFAGKPMTEADKKRAERKVQREERKQKIDLLTQQEHVNSGQDKEEIEKIEIARRTFGEYKLKRDKDYEVPEEQQVNHLKKRQQMILLESSIHNIKVKFNDKVQELRKRKVAIIETVDGLYARLNEINGELGEADETVKFSIDDKTENPAKMYTVTDEQIENYREELKRREEEEKNKNKPQGKKKRQQEMLTGPADKGEAKSEAKKAEGNNPDVMDHERQAPKRTDQRTQENDLYNEIKLIRQIELQYEKSKLKEEIDKTLNDFDEEIYEMQKEKYRLESDLKNAEIKLILLYEELVLLQSLEAKDQELTLRLQESKGQKGHIIRAIQNITRQLEEKKETIETIQNKENDLKRQFHELVPENHAKYAELSAYYEKLNQRRKKPEKKKEEAGEDEEEDGEVVEEEPEEEEEEDDLAIQNIAQHDEKLKIDDIDNLRSQRMELWDTKTQISEQIGKLQKEQKALDKQEKEVEATLNETQEEIKDFQLEKLKKLNELEMSIVLEIEKIQNLEKDHDMFRAFCEQKEPRWQELADQIRECQDEEQERQLREMQDNMWPDYRGFVLPKKIGESVLFTATQLQKLLDRQAELKSECDNLKLEENASKNKFKMKQKAVHEEQRQRDLAQHEYDERRMLRFGNLVDLDNLEVSGPSQAVIELQLKFAKTDKRCYVQKEEAEQELQRTQRDLTDAIQKNTYFLDGIRQLGETLQKQIKQLESANKAIFVDEDNEEKRKMQSEREKYKEVLRKQAEDINKIKNEINLYKRKGGHIYTKVTTNRKVASLNDN